MNFSVNEAQQEEAEKFMQQHRLFHLRSLGEKFAWTFIKTTYTNDVIVEISCHCGVKLQLSKGKK